MIVFTVNGFFTSLINYISNPVFDSNYFSGNAYKTSNKPYNYTNQSYLKWRRWCSGSIEACGAFSPGSTPGLCPPFFDLISDIDSDFLHC